MEYAYGIGSSPTFKDRRAQMGSLLSRTEVPWGPKTRTPFTEMLPFDKVFNPSLITALAESQINPEIARQKADAVGQQQRGFAQSGSFRSGYAPFQRQQLSDQYERQRREQVQGFSDNINNMANDWYTREMERYGKNPSAYVMPTLPTFDEFMGQNQGLSNLYSNMTNVPNMYQSPFAA